jgi:uncharacterized protein YukE
MKFDLPNAVAAMNNAVAAVGDDGDGWDVIGDPLSKPIDEVLPAYDDKLDLKLNPKPGDKRREICGLVWGRINKDAARLNGLAAAIDNISSVIKSGKERLAHDWKGEAFDNFRQAVEKIETTLNDYAAAVKTAASDLQNAVENLQTLFGTYREQSLSSHFKFDGLAKPEDWWRMSERDAEFLVANCISGHGFEDNCCYNDDEQLGIINGRLVTRRLFDRLVSWDCTDDPGVVIDQYRTTVGDAKEERSHVSGKIHNWYIATDQLKSDVDEMFDAALENLRKIAESKVFAAMSVPGAGPAAGGGPEAGGDPGPGGGDTGGYPGGGGPGGGEAAMPPQSEPHPQPEPAQVEPAAAPEPAQPKPAEVVSDGETVTIKDGDRSIAVTSPDGEGHVKVTVEGGDGQAKGYDLDFDAASGQPRDDAARPEPGAEHVPAGTNGQCVIKDGPLTITAERPLFDPGTIKLEVDDGVNEPTVYTLDFEETSGDADQPATDKPEDRAPDAPGAKAHAEPATTSPPATADASNGPAADVAPSGQPVPDEAPGSQPADGEQEQVTTPQAVRPDQPAALSGLLVPDQSTGEAELASASDDQAGDQAGSGTGTGAMPMMAGAGAGTSDGGRAGTGWSVHGDLFDNHDPVYSMHGVLGEDDLEGR